ncbi:hypothetical protein Tco_0876314 [Tanacetum coccineum]|uniref:Reverse transcriptase Ty1/copia-type domain-containing protein n=1 Tax=Tanacetum coccineum TaxID=301880 RepID=A0ABQ5BV25_9ASTR
MNVGLRGDDMKENVLIMRISSYIKRSHLILHPLILNQRREVDVAPSYTLETSTPKALCDLRHSEGFIERLKLWISGRIQLEEKLTETETIVGVAVWSVNCLREEKEDGIFISQDKYVDEILKKFDFATVKTSSTPMEPNKALVKDEEADSVDVHLYGSMIGSLMYLTASMPDIMFAVCACARFQVTPKMSHLYAVKRIFRYLKGQPKLGLWYPRDSPFDLEAFSDRVVQFLGKRLISWQCKKQTIVANSTTKAEYVAAANCCRQVLWIQNQVLDYGFNFINTKIFIDNESTICIVKNLVFYSKTKHIEIRHHFIRDCYEKKSIQVIKIHTDHNVVDLLTKAFDVSRLNFLMVALDYLISEVAALPQTSVPLDHRADKAVHKEGTQAPRYHSGGADAQTRPETASKTSCDPPLSDFVPPTPHDSPLSGGNTLGSDEGRMELIQELMETYTSLKKRVLALEEAKTTQDIVITRLKLRVKRLEKKRKARTPQPMKRRLSNYGRKGSSEKGGSIADQVSNARPEVSAAIILVNVSAATPSTPPTTITIFGDEDLAISQTLMKMRSEKAKEKEKGVVLIDEEEPPRLNRSTTTLQPLPTIDPKDKGKGVLVEEEPEKPGKLAELDRAQKERQKQEEATSAALAEEFDEIQARIDVDHELANSLKEESTNWLAERAVAHKDKPPYKNSSLEQDDYLPQTYGYQWQAESTKKIPRADSEKESSKKQKLEEDNDAKKEELRDSKDVVPRDDVAIDVESLATKYTNVDWKNHILIENIASNMCGKENGLKPLILNECPFAYYVHCFAHQLELALVAASKDVDVIQSRQKKDDVTVEHHYWVDVVTMDPRKSFNADDICKPVTKYHPLDFTKQERIDFKLELQQYELDND